MTPLHPQYPANLTQVRHRNLILSASTPAPYRPLINTNLKGKMPLTPSNPTQ